MPVFFLRFVLTGLIKEFIQYLLLFIYLVILCHLMKLNKIAFSIISFIFHIFVCLIILIVNIVLKIKFFLVNISFLKKEI
jgi:hypothetical protein